MTMIGDAVPSANLFGLCLSLAYPRGKDNFDEFYTPKYHVVYKERLFDFKDGVEKWVGTRAGGRGEKYPEDMW
jgi:hypothetical protein